MIGHTKVSGPLAKLADGFRTELDRLGYTLSSREFKLAEVARLSAWLEGRGLGVRDICSARLEEFLADLAVGSGRARTLVAMRPLLGWLRDGGLCGEDPPPVSGPLDELIGRYRHWMVTDRASWRLARSAVTSRAPGCSSMTEPARVGDLPVSRTSARRRSRRSCWPRRRGGFLPSRCRGGWRS